MKRSDFKLNPVAIYNRILFKAWPLLFLFYTIQSSFAQESLPGNSIYQAFDKEMDKQVITNTDTRKHKTLRSQLPEWWGQIPEETTDTVYSMGISDPGLPDSTAFNQAFIRACALVSLANSCVATHLSEFYFKSRSAQSNSKYEEMCRLSSDIQFNPGQCKILRSAKLKSREVILLMSFPKKNRENEVVPLFCKGYQYAFTTDIEGSDKMIWKYQCIIGTNRNKTPIFRTDTVTFYQYNMKFIGVKNLCQKMNSAKKQTDYYYTSVTGQTADDKSNAYTDCTSGLWIALMNRIFLQTSYFVKKRTNQTQVVRDQTGTGGNELEREKTEYKTSIQIRQIEVKMNGLRIYTNLSHDE